MEAAGTRLKLDPALDPHARRFWRAGGSYGASSGA